MVESGGTIRNFFSILAMVLRQPESILTWGMMIALTYLTANSVDPTGMSTGLFTVQAWHWLVLAAVLQFALFFDALRNPKSFSQVQSLSFKRELDPNDIRNPVSREQLIEALQYHEHILEFVKSTNASSAIQRKIASRLEDISNWVRDMHHKALKIDNFEANDLIKQDLFRIPGHIREVEEQIATEADEILRVDLEARREQLQLQHENLIETERDVDRERISLQNTRVSLATIYAQLTRLDTLRSIDGTRAHSLREEMRDVVDKLSDVLDTMDEMHSADRYGAASG